MKLLAFLWVLGSLTTLRALAEFTAPFPLSKQILRGDEVAFVPHTDTTPFGSYLIMNLPVAPSKEFFDIIVSRLSVKLINRGEAHITVITPPEYDGVLRNFITMDEINQIATRENIQKTEVEAICLGRARAVINERKLDAYFVVVKAPGLILVRDKIYKRYVEKGGEPSRFDPRHFYSHITIGFTERDLQESDGIFKGTNACIGSLSLHD